MFTTSQPSPTDFYTAVAILRISISHPQLPYEEEKPQLSLHPYAISLWILPTTPGRSQEENEDQLFLIEESNNSV